SWDAVAVTPIPYVKRRRGKRESHASLWRDLRTLADLAEEPRNWCRKHARSALARPFDGVARREADIVAWSLRSDSALWSDLVAVEPDAAWIDHLGERKLIDGKHQ